MAESPSSDSVSTKLRRIAKLAQEMPETALTSLTLHPEKTRLMPIRQPPKWSNKQPKRSFDFLGFTHHWGRSTKGGWIVKRRTAKDRFSRSLHAIRQWCRKHRHDPLARQHQVLSRKLLGHYAYYGVTGNFGRLRAMRDEVQRAWRKWLDRRCWKAGMNWEKFQKLRDRYPLPRARIMKRYGSPVANP